MNCCLKNDVGGSHFTLTRSSVEVVAQGWLAELQYTMSYHNNSDEPVHSASFSFPLDDSSAVFRFEANVCGRLIVCECRDKKEAQEAFKAAVDQGMPAAFVSESDDSSDVFSCSLGNVAAKGDVQVRLWALAEMDSTEAEAGRLTVPRVSVSRYRPSETSGRPDAHAPPVAGEWLLKPGVRCRVRDLPGLSLASLSCPQATVRPLADESNAFELVDIADSCDLELTLRYRLAEVPSLLVARETGNPKIFPGDALTCELVLGSEVKPPEDEKTELIIVVDRSFSMSGSNIDSAKEALLLFLKSLPVNCRFNVVSFGSRFESLFKESRQYSQQSLESALQLQRSMEADMGGTELLRPLEWILQQEVKGSIRRGVFLLTDGEVSNVSQVMDCVRAACNGSATRVHSIGIGHGASTSLVKGVARVGGGHADFVREANSTELRRAVIGLLRANQLPPVQQLQLSATGSVGGAKVKLHTVPQQLHSVSACESRARAFALLPENFAKDVTVSASCVLAGLKIKVASRPVARPRDPPFESPIGQLAAARRQIKDWTDANGKGKHTESIKQLSVATGLSSAYTAFVGVDKETRVPPPRGEAVYLEDKADCSMDDLCRDGPPAQQTSTPAPPPPGQRSDPGPDPVMVAAELQQFNGCWQPTDRLLAFLSMTVDKFDSCLPKGLSRDAWATALAVCLLRDRLQHRQDEWQLLAAKATQFLRPCCASAELSVDQVLAAASAALK